ncbi:hypothetical protein ACLOJK_021724 [Asimina triloba]
MLINDSHGGEIVTDAACAIQSAWKAEEAVYGMPAKMVFEPGSPLYEWNWEQELQKEIEHIVFQSLFKTLYEDFRQLSAEKNSCLCHNQNKNLFLKVGELSSLCQDLNDILRSLFGFDLSKIPSQGSLEILEEFINEIKNQIQQKALGSHVSASASRQDKFGSSCIENSQDSKTMPPETMDYHHLKHLSKEEIINHFKAKLTDMKRGHELTLQKMAEDYFSLRRGSFKEKGSCHNRKDKDFDTLGKKIQEVMLKLNDIVLENKKSPTFCDGYENIFRLKERVNTLLSENKHLQDMLVHKSEEVESLSLKMEANFSKWIDLEDLMLENCIADDVFKCVLRECIGPIGQNTHEMQDSDIQDSFVSEISAIIFKQAVSDAETSFNLSIAKHNEEKKRIIHLEEKLLENENGLHFTMEEIGKLKEEKEMVYALMEEIEKSALEMGSILMEQKKHVELVCTELNSLRDQAKQQEVLLVEAKWESQLINGRLDEASEKIGFYEVEISKLKWQLEVAANQLWEAETERSLLFGIIQHKQNSISAAISQEQEQRKTMQSISASVHELLTGMADFECKAMGNMTNNFSRLEMLNQQYRMLVQLANTFKRKELAYKERLERQNSDLQMAEAEVDLLGDEVDALLSLLSKMYIALDHYSLILQHYPGVMEILKLVKRKLKGETTKMVDQKYPMERSTATSTTSTALWKRATASHSVQSNRMNEGGSNAYALLQPDKGSR